MKRLLPLLLAFAWCGSAAAQTYLGDYYLGDTVRCPWSTYKPSTGDSVARATAGTVTVYADNGAGNGFNTTESGTGVTDTSGFDSKTGEHTAVIVTTAANGYAAAKDYAVMVQSSTITDTGTVTFSAWPCNFSIENRAGTRYSVKDRGTLASGSTSTTIQLGAKISANDVWNGMIFRDLTTSEQALICATTNSGSTDSLTVAGLITTPGSSDVYQIIWNNLPGTCLNAPAGSGLPLVDANGGVTVSHMGASGATAPALSDKAGSNFNTFSDNGAATFSGTISSLYAAATNADTHIGTPSSLGSGATVAGNLQDINTGGGGSTARSAGGGTTWIASGLTDQRVAFYTGITGLASGATVYRQRGTNSAATFTTPDIQEDGSVVGLYRLLVDEDTTITSGKETEQMTFIIVKGAVIVPVTIMLFDRISVNVASMNGSTVNGTGTSGDPWKH